MENIKFSKKNVFEKILRHDISAGILQAYKKWIVTATFFISFCFIFLHQIKMSLGTAIKPSIFDFYCYIFGGMKIYIPTSEESFPMPIGWLTVHLLLALLLSGYVTRDLTGNGQHFLIRSSKRTIWWNAKVLWSICFVVVYYFIAFLVITVFSAFFGTLNINFSVELFQVLGGNTVTASPNIYDILITMLLPLYTSIALSLLQITIELYTEPIWGIAIVFTLYLGSSYLYIPGFLGNGSMIYRAYWLLEIPYTLPIALISNLLIIIFAFLFGYLNFYKKNILSKS